MTRHRAVALLLVSALLLAGVAPLAAMATGTAGPSATGEPGASHGVAADHTDRVYRATTSEQSASTGSTADSDRIRVESDLSLTPERPGSVGVRQTFTLPDRLTALTVSLPADVQVHDSDGFSRTNERTWQWDGETTSPTLSYAMAANQTAQQGGPLAADGTYVFADAGEWALVQRPAVGLQWRQRGLEPITPTRTASVAGEGAVGGETAFLGPHRVLTHRANGQTFRLVVPAAAEMAESPAAVFASLEAASGSLHVGDRDEEVFVVAAPTGVDWAAGGLQVGDSDAWVQADERVDGVQNVWVHEYVHTRQSFTTEPSARWLNEATATWYAARISLAQGDVAFGRFARFLDRGSERPQSESVLSEPSTWRNAAQYHKGALVAGELDRRIRLASGKEASLQTVIRRLNDHSDPVGNADVLAAVADVSGQSTRNAAARFTETSAVPSMWDRDAHESVFEPTPALMSVVVDPTNARVSGPYRESGVDRPIVLVTGETLSVPVQVTNVGSVAGPYDVTLRVNDDVSATADGRLEPEASTTVTVDHTFDSPGEYTVSVAGEQVPVVVREPATPRVTSLSADRETVAPGDSVRLTAEVLNPESIPGRLEVSFTRDGRTVATRTVAVGPGESATVTVPIQLNESGTHRLGAGGAQIHVTVGDSGAGADGDERTETVIPGFGVVAAAVAVAVAGLVARRQLE